MGLGWSMGPPIDVRLMGGIRGIVGSSEVEYFRFVVFHDEACVCEDLQNHVITTEEKRRR